MRSSIVSRRKFNRGSGSDSRSSSSVLLGPARKRPDGLLCCILERPHGLVLSVLHLFDQHHGFALILISLVVLEPDLAENTVPFPGVQHLACLLPVSACSRCSLSHDHHRLVGARSMVGRRLAELLYITLEPCLGSLPRRVLGPLRGREDALADFLLLGELNHGEPGAGAEEGHGSQPDLTGLAHKQDGV